MITKKKSFFLYYCATAVLLIGPNQPLRPNCQERYGLQNILSYEFDLVERGRYSYTNVSMTSILKLDLAMDFLIDGRGIWLFRGARNMIGWLELGTQITGCGSHFENLTNFKILKEPLLVLKQMIHQIKALNLSFSMVP